MTTQGNVNRKREAFKSFLETTASPSTIQTKKNASDNEAVYQQEYVEQSTNCSVCGNEVPDAIAKKKICGFCQQATCLDHLRKRRRKKTKWQKICDSCEDKFLYDTYMKLEIKAEQSLAVQEEIVGMKYDDVKQLLQSKKIKRRELSFAYQEMTSKHDQKMMALIKEDNRYQSLNNKLQSDEIACGQVEQYINRMENKIKSNYEQDYRILTEEDSKLGAELSRIQKKCSEVRAAIEKREKQLEEAYEQWQRKQYGKVQQQIQNNQRQQQKDGGCYIF